jgi:hypothetical protein
MVLGERQSALHWNYRLRQLILSLTLNFHIVGYGHGIHRYPAFVLS